MLIHLLLVVVLMLAEERAQALPLRGGQEELASADEIVAHMGLANSRESPRQRVTFDGPIRFAEAGVGDQSRSTTKGSIGPCSCDFLSGVSATKPVGSTPKCAPISALCMFCMNAAFNVYWGNRKDTCEDYIGDAQTLCKSVAGAVSGAKKDMHAMYMAYGPSFGASAAYCRDGGCCAGSDAVS